jgi:cytochrome b561
MKNSVEKYTKVAVALHWVMAVSFILMLASGITMGYIEIEKSLKFNLYQWHKSLGVLLLVAFFLRIGWRIFNKPPALPTSFPKIERIAAHAGHWGLYVWMVLLPLTGWAMVSSSVYGLPTIVFGWFEWPHVPGLEGNEDIHELAETAHMILAFSFIALILGHVAAVVKHAVKDGENLLKRMWF